MPNIIIASGPVIIEDGRVLLVQHGEDNFWKFCGGRVETGEFNVKETAKREAKEEMGIDIEIIDTAPYFFYTEKEKDGQIVSVILIHFLSKRIGEINTGEDIKKWAWIDLNDLKKENLAPNIIPVLEHFKNISKK